MTLNELKTLCNPIALSGPQPGSVGTLVQDSRAVEEGSVFIAVRGTQVDGHVFIEDAITNGASIVICEEVPEGYPDTCFLQVEHTRSLVGPLAQAFEENPGQSLRVIGVTGTNGKTTVATLTYQVLQALGERPSLLGTVAKRIDDEILDSNLTTADPIELASDMRRMVEAGSKHLVMEVSSHALDQQRVDGIDFEVTAFTNLSHDHLDYHTDIKNYARAKKRLFDALSPEATAVINADDRQHAFMASDCAAEIHFFGFESKKGIRCKLLKSSNRGLQIQVEDTKIESPLVGRFNAYNVAQTFLICRAMGYNEKAIAQALQSATGAAGRLQRVQIKNRPNQPLVLVDYAHTPGALENVLGSLVNMKQEKQRVHVIFGCGGDRDKTKRPKMAGVAEQYADHVTITSDNPRSEDPDAIIDDAMNGFIHPKEVARITDRKKAIEHTIAEADKNTIILIAGKGHETYQEIKGKRHPFDDREIARSALAKRNGNLKTPEVR